MASHRPALNFRCSSVYGATCSGNLLRGYNVRVYIPFGREWYPTLLRRLADRPANVLFIAKNMLRKMIKVMKRVSGHDDYLMASRRIRSRELLKLHRISWPGNDTILRSGKAESCAIAERCLQRDAASRRRSRWPGAPRGSDRNMHLSDASTNVGWPRRSDTARKRCEAIQVNARIPGKISILSPSTRCTRPFGVGASQAYFHILRIDAAVIAARLPCIHRVVVVFRLSESRCGRLWKQIYPSHVVPVSMADDDVGYVLPGSTPAVSPASSGTEVSLSSRKFHLKALIWGGKYCRRELCGRHRG